MPTDFNAKNNELKQNAPELDDDAIWDLLSLYADEEATPEQADQVEALLNSDSRLAQDLQFLRMTGAAAQTFAEVEPPAALRDTIFAATTRRQTMASRLLAYWDNLRQSFAPRSRYALALGGMAAAALLAVAVGPQLMSPKVSTVNIPTKEIVATVPTVPQQPKSSTAEEIFMGPPIRRTPVEIAKTTSVTVPSVSAAKTTLAKFDVHPYGPVKPSAPRSSTGGSGVKPPVQNNVPTPTEETVAMPSIRPKMDQENRHMPGPNRMLPPGPITPDETLTANLKDPPPAPNPDPNVVKHEPTPEIKVTSAKLPPETYQFLTNAQMKQQQKATTLGYDRDTVKSIQRKELTVSLIHGSL